MLAEAGQLMAVGAGMVAGLMLLLWLLHFALRNASVVDPGWAGGLALLGFYYGVAGQGDETRRLAMAAMVVAWGLRLALFLLLTRVVGQEEEGRYVELRRKWGRHIGWKFLVFFEFQAVLSVLLSAPFALVAVNGAQGLVPFEYAGMALWAVGLVGETVADWQLWRFKRDARNKGRVCRVGLWRYSRHPNYFFEWLIWMAYALFACGSPYGALTFAAPALMLYFLFRVTGIPATEEQALRTKGPAYREYQRTTSAFVPWFVGH